MTRVYVVLFAIVAIFPVLAAGSDDIENCADIADDARRLECYDLASSDERAEEGPETARTSTPATLADSTDAEVPSNDAQESFGLQEEREAAEQESEPDQISARITKIEMRRNGERLFTLDNGQVWVEDAPKPSLRLDVGDTVTIKAGLFGSHRLFGSGKRSSGVDRVR